MYGVIDGSGNEILVMKLTPVLRSLLWHGRGVVPPSEERSEKQMRDPIQLGDVAAA